MIKKEESIDKIKYLLENYKIDINEKDDKGYTSLIYVVEAEDIDIIKLLLDCASCTDGAKIDFDLNNILFKIPLSCVDMTELLISLGANINATIKYKQRNPFGHPEEEVEESLIKKALTRGRYEFAKMLLKHNVYLTQKDYDDFIRPVYNGCDIFYEDKGGTEMRYRNADNLNNIF
jgi:Ankyrin repeats (many copies)